MERKRIKGRFAPEDKGGVIKRNIAAPAANPQAPTGRARSLVGQLLDKWKRARSGGNSLNAASAQAAD